MPPRWLRATPSTPADLSKWQDTLLEQFDKLFDDYQNQRKPLSHHLSVFEDKYQADPDCLKASVSELLERAGFDKPVIDGHLEVIFPAPADEVSGMRKVSPWLFSFKENSLWRGNPPNHVIRKLARSMIVSGFRDDSVIASRTLSLSGAPCSLSLGDGSARAIAAVIVWLLLVQSPNLTKDDHLQHLVWTLSGVSVNFEKHGTGSPKEILIAQASRQNQAAAVQPVSTIQWLNMIRQYLGQPIGSSYKNTSQVQQVLEEMVENYNKHAEVMAYDVDTAPSRKKRRTKLADDDGSDTGLKIGRRRLLSMKAFLSGGNDEILDEIVQHITVVGDYKVSALTDELLQLKQIYIGSKLSKDQVPSEAQRTALHAAGDAVKSWMDDASAMAEIKYDTPLTSEQFVMLWRKMIKSYEAAIAGMTAPDTKVKERSKPEAWINARKVVQLWDQSIEPVASKHLSQEDFKALSSFVLESTALDDELIGVLDRMPKYFHMGLIPALASDEAESVDCKEARVLKAQFNAELANLDAFKETLQADWDKISAGAKGAAQLGELLSWIEIKHRRQQAKICEELIDKKMAESFPMITIVDWPKAAAAMSLIKQAHAKTTIKSIAVIDFNVPAARDVLKMPSMISATAEMLKVLGVKDSVLFAIMPNAPKLHSKSSAFDDEVTISKLLTKAGFANQERIRQVVAMPPHIANKVSQLDWFVDARLCFLSEPKDNFFLMPLSCAELRL